MEKDPKVTVLIPVYNSEKYLKECIDSILTQTFTDFECLVIDDASTDGSVGVIKSFADPRIRLVVNEQNLGIARNRNKGFQLAKGEYVAFMDSDDVSVPERLAKQVAFMEAHPEVGICGSYMELVDSGGRKIEVWDCPTDHDALMDHMLRRCPLWNPTLIIRTRIVLEHQLDHNPNYVAASDLDWYIRLTKVTRMANLPEMLHYYRRHDSQVTSSRKFESIRNGNNLYLGVMLDKIRENWPGVTDQIVPIVRGAPELTYLDNLLRMNKLIAGLPVNKQNAALHKKLSNHVTNIWLETLEYLPKYTLPVFRIIKQSPFYKSLPVKAQVSIWGKSLLGLDRSATKRMGTLMSSRKQVA